MPLKPMPTYWVALPSINLSSCVTCALNPIAPVLLRLGKVGPALVPKEILFDPLMFNMPLF